MGRINRYVFLFFLFLSLHLIFAYGFSSVFTLDSVIKWGIEHNNTIEDLIYKIDATKRTLQRIDAERDWQLNLSGKYGEDKTDLSLKATKYLTDTLNIQMSFSLNQDGNIGLSPQENVKNKAAITINERLYPAICDDMKKNYIKTYNELLKLKATLKWQRETVKRDIITKYLELLRLRELFEIDKVNYTFFQKKLDEAEALYEMKEIDKTELYTKRLNLKDAEYTLKQGKIKFEEAKRDFCEYIGISKDCHLDLTEKDPCIAKLQRDVDLFLQKRDLFSTLHDIHPDLISYGLDLELANKKIKWVEAEGKPRVDLKAEYNLSSGDFGVYLFLDYNILDSGSQHLKERDSIEELKKIEKDLSHKVKKIREEILSIENTIELDKLRIDEKRLAYEKAKYEEQLARSRLEGKTITDIDYQNTLIKLKKSYIELKGAKDTLFIDKLRLAQFGGYEIR